MSLFRTIFAFENGREVANLGFVFTECLRSASTPKIGDKVDSKWDERDLDVV